MNFNEWKKCTLGDLVTFQRGHDLSKAKMMEGKYPVTGSNGIIGYHNEYTTEAPCITIGRSGNVGNPFYYNEKCWAHNTTLYIKKFHQVDPKFIYYYLKTLDLGHYAGGSAVPTLNRNHIHPIEVYVPTDVEEQKAIANILSSLDEKIELNNQMNKTLEEVAQALFKRWFVDFEFPNENGEPYKSSGGEMVDSEVGLIPKGWEVGCLGKLIKVQNGYAFKSKDLKDDGEVRVIKIKNISGNKVDINETQFVSQEVANQTNPKFVIHPFDILIAMTGAEVGKIGLVPNNSQQLLLNQRVGNIQEVLQGGKAYAFSILTKESTQEIILTKAMGSAQPNISSSGIEEIKIIVPCAKTLKEFNQIINPTIIKKGENDFENNYLESIRDTLLPKLMSGEIRVTDLQS